MTMRRRAETILDGEVDNSKKFAVENAFFEQFSKYYETCRKRVIYRPSSGCKIRQMLTFYL